MECYWVLGQRIDFLSTGETTGGLCSLFHLFIPAGPTGPLPHTHRDADEFFYVVEGDVEILFVDTWRPLGPGLRHGPVRPINHLTQLGTSHRGRPGRIPRRRGAVGRAIRGRCDGRRGHRAGACRRPVSSTSSASPAWESRSSARRRVDLEETGPPGDRVSGDHPDKRLRPRRKPQAR